MPKDSKSSGSMTKAVGTIAVVIAAFLVLRFVFGILSGILTWGLIAAAVVVVLWLFLGSSDSSGSGPD